MALRTVGHVAVGLPIVTAIGASRVARALPGSSSGCYHSGNVMGPFGATELIVVLCIILLLFGANKIPQLASGLGQGIRNFKKGLRDDDETKDRPRLPEKTDDNKVT
jgi:sec-independent protein translocase protein TatA